MVSGLEIAGIIVVTLAVIGVIVFFVMKRKKSEVLDLFSGEAGSINQEKMLNFWLASKSNMAKLFGSEISVSEQEKIFDSNPVLAQSYGSQKNIFEEIIARAAGKVKLKLDEKKKEDIRKGILHDEDLVKKMIRAKSKEKKARLVERWLKRRKQKEKKKEHEPEPKVTKRVRHKTRAVRGSGKGDGKGRIGKGHGSGKKGRKGKGHGSPRSRTGKKKNGKRGAGAPKSNIKGKGKKISKRLKKVQRLYEDMVKFLKTGQIDKLITLIRKMTSKDVRDMIENYGKIQFEDAEEHNKINEILRKAHSKKDMVQLIKTEVVNNLQMKFEELKDLLSTARKKGYNVRHEDLQLMSVPYKIKIFEATFKKKDFLKAEDTIVEIERSIEIIAPELKKKKKDGKKKGKKKGRKKARQ